MDKTPDEVMDEIIEGAHGGGKPDVADIQEFLLGWSQWLVDLINIIKNFFAQLRGA